jgi:hypothetical protein
MEFILKFYLNKYKVVPQLQSTDGIEMIKLRMNHFLQKYKAMMMDGTVNNIKKFKCSKF